MQFWNRKGSRVYNTPLYTRVLSLSTQYLKLKEATSGGLIGVQTDLDPSLTKADGLVGNVAGKPGTLPEVHTELKLNVTLFKYVIGTDEKILVEPLRKGEPLRINIGSATSLGYITAVGSDWIELNLIRPIAAETGWKAALARRLNGQWRLVGVGEVT